MKKFNEDTRVKIPATLHFLKIGYEYQSLSESDIDYNTKIFVNRFKPAIETINGRSFSDDEIDSLLAEIFTLIKSHDLGKSFHKRLIDTTADVKLLDFDNIDNNDFAVVDELPFTIERGTENGSFRPDINILINGIPLAFLEVKKPNNEGGIQQEFKRMINDRLITPEYGRFFNLIQFVSFSNNMRYEVNDDADKEAIRAGSFYTTPNGTQTSFSFFREDIPNYHNDHEYKKLKDDYCRDIIKDLGYSPTAFDTPEFQTNCDIHTPCNEFITSVFDKERFLYILRYGILYLDLKTPEKHIMRYPQFFATRAIIDRLDNNVKRGIIWHTQGSGKTELAAYANRIVRDYYAKENTLTRFFFVTDRLELLRQASSEFATRNFEVTNCSSIRGFSKELNTIIPKDKTNATEGEMVVVNIQKFESAIPKAKNDYGSNIQRVFFVDEAHRSYSLHGEYFKNLILCDPDAVFIGLTGTPLLSKKERSNLKFGDYIHKYFYDRSIADGYTLRIKKEKIDTLVRKDLKNNLEMEKTNVNDADGYESDSFVNDIGKYIEKDFQNFRLTNQDKSIGGMIVCKSNPQAKKLYEWFCDNSKLSAGLVMSDEENPTQCEMNKNFQSEFKYNGTPDILIVHYMLTTGYDVSRLKKMYLLRGPQAQNLLQTISRVNRPYKAPNGKVYHYGYITDFVDIEEEYDRTINDYLKELEKDINDTDDDEHNSLNGLVVDIDTIKARYEKSENELKNIIDAENMELYSQKLTYTNKDTLYLIKRLLNTMKDCFTELLLSNDLEGAGKIDIELIKSKLKVTQERIDFVNIKEEPVRILDIISDKDVVEIFYEFIKSSISIIDLSRFDPTNSKYDKFVKTIKKVQDEIKKNRNKDDINIVKLDKMLRELFEKMNVTDMADLDDINEELRIIFEEATRINKENDRLAAIYDDNFALVKTYQDSTMKHQDLSNKEIEKAIMLIYDSIKDGLERNILVIQGRQGFIDETKKNATKALLKGGVYKSLNLKDWLDMLLSDMYTNLQNY